MQNSPVALVTGANKGIGRQVAKDLTDRGFIVLVGSRDLERGETAATEIGGNAVAVQLDVANEASVADTAERIRREFGRLDVLVNNAGVSFIGDPETPLQQRAASGLLTAVPLDVVREMYEINVFGVIAITQALLPLLHETPNSRIVNVGSGGGSLTYNSDETDPHRSMFGVYSASKSALHAVSLAFATALETAGINVFIVDPGMTATSLNNFQGTRTVEEGAHHIVEMALLESGGRTGSFTSDEGVVPW